MPHSKAPGSIREKKGQMGQSVAQAPRFEPEFDGSLSAWAFTVALKQAWRTRPDYDVDDLMGEARFMFWKIRETYKDRVENQKHFATLFRTAFINRIHRLAELRSKNRSVPASVLSPRHDLFDGIRAKDDGVAEAELNLLIASAPPEIKQLLRAYFPAGEDGEDATARLEVIASRSPVVNGDRIIRPVERENLNNTLCRVSGQDPRKVDMVGRVRRWLGVEAPMAVA